MILQERFPVPRLVVCDQHGSQLRSLVTLTSPYILPCQELILVPCTGKIFVSKIEPISNIQ
ncbi:hypothetical protein Golob_025568 [Gossypium lobatum]|uniref:Protein transport protein SEC23 n=2 Tax=Gossypium TaxID=3633 RepID=A0A7J8X250_GOSAI|nr:hypothetical protein [Gossypium lobatum]MBA0681356.1 hypothetical protein [Gossypium aridum]